MLVIILESKHGNEDENDDTLKISSQSQSARFEGDEFKGHRPKEDHCGLRQ